MNEKQMDWLTEMTARTLFAAVDREQDIVARTICTVGEEMGDEGVYSLCCGLAAAILAWRFPGTKRGDGTLTGNTLAMIPPAVAEDSDPRTLWAMRFVAAQMNGDGATSLALFTTALHDRDRLLGGMAALAKLTGDTGRWWQANHPHPL